MSMTPSRLQRLSFKLKHAAADGRLFVCRCNHCQRTDVYLATDLVEVMNPELSVIEMFQTCRHCGRSEYQQTSTRLPNPDDVGHLRIRRPTGVKITQLWEDAWYGGAGL